MSQRYDYPSEPRTGLPKLAHSNAPMSCAVPASVKGQPKSAPPQVRDPNLQQVVNAIWPQFEAGVKYLKDR